MTSVCSSNESVRQVSVRGFSLSLRTIFARIIAYQREYREWRQAMELSDRALQDMGIGRGDLDREYRGRQLRDGR